MLIVPDRVLDEVADQAFKQHAVADDEGRFESEIKGDTGGVGGARQLANDISNQLSQADQRVVSQRALTARQREQAIDEALTAVSRGAGRFSQPAFTRGDIRRGQRDIGLRPHDRQRRAQFVGDLGGKRALGGKGRFQPRQHRVDGVRELLELIWRPPQPNSLTERRFGGMTGMGGDLPDGPQHTARHHPAEDDGPGRGDDERDERLREHRAEGIGPLFIARCEKLVLERAFLLALLVGRRQDQIFQLRTIKR